ncbi:MAG: 30S ribosome-binding factor RbfA [Burkholderiales bacterium]|nr:30S ribosome-binding factor RbfA [Opitutaceae bacterium]
MSTRTLRVNELIQRELSNLLRRKYNAESASITITAVEVTPDVREGKVFVSVIGDEEQAADRMKWLRKHNKELRFALGDIIILKHMPVFTFELDTVTDRGNRILGLLDEISVKEKKPAADATPPPPEDAS